MVLMKKEINVRFDMADLIESNGEFFVFNVLLLYMDHSNIVYNKVSEMCVKAKCTEKTFKSHLWALIEQGFIIPAGAGYMVNPQFAYKATTDADLEEIFSLYTINLHGGL